MDAGPRDVLAGAAAAECLSGGGEMGALMRATDWSRTAVGPVETWPQSLRTALSMLLETGFPMYIAWGPDFTQFYNDGYRPILGSTKHPALGLSTRQTFAEIWDIIGPMFQGVLQGTATNVVDFLLPLDRHGFVEECYFIFSYSPIREERGRVGGVLVTVTETTQRILGARRLKALHELALNTRNAPSAESACAAAAAVLAGHAADLPFALVYLLDAEGRRATLRGAAGLAAGEPGAPLAVELDDGAAPWPLGPAVRTGEPQLLDAERGPAGPGRALVLPVMEPGADRAAGVLVAGVSPRLLLDQDYRDFLSLVAAQIATAVAGARALAEAQARADALAELDRAKTAFFSNVSHEFRTPLTLILGPLGDGLAAGGLGGPALEAVHRNAQRLLKLVNTLLDFSRIEAGRAQAVYEETDLCALSRELASGFRSLLSQAGLAFEVDCEPVGAPVYVDRSMWEKIVLNLLSNAFKFTFAGTVRLSLRGVPGAAELRVEDTGTGVPAAELPRLFERFHRVEGARSRSHEGSGIGLALVRELVGMHGGSIHVRSVEGAGTAFTVRVPTGRAHLPAERVREGHAPAAPSQAAALYAEEARRWLPEGAPRGAAHHSHSARVLIVDDNADMREYLARLLAPSWAVEVAVNGAEALGAIAARRPDLVLTDVMMPEVDGFELLRRLRAAPETRTLPVIMLSARAGEEAVIEGLAAGADDYLVKPFSSREVVARVRTQLELARLRQEAALQQERLVTLLRTAPAAIAVVRGPDHVFDFANDLYLGLVGREDLLGKPGRVALPELTAQGVWDLFDRVYATGAPYRAHAFPARLARLGGGGLDEGFFDFVLQPLPDARGQLEGILVHAVETTEAVRAREVVEEARRAAEAANRAKDEFLAMLGHELRNPLAPILTALQLMKLRHGDLAQRERALIERQVSYLVRLVDDLLDVARVARGKIALREETVEIAAVVARAIETASPLLERHRHSLSVRVPPGGCPVHGDPDRLAQVVANLLTNAAKYTKAGGHIAVTAEPDGGEVVLRVRDNGIGIGPEMLPRVFDLFTQDSQALDRSQGGLGLGLAIVKSFVALHGGTVSAHSEGRDRGSEFVIRLPRAAAAPAAAPPPAAAPAAEAAGVRVLIVDDNEDAALMLGESLSALRCETRLASNGPEALRIHDEFAPQVCLLDIGLPVMDGYELAEKLRARGSAATLVAVTGYGQDSDRQRSCAAGFDAHLVKPVRMESLVPLLRALREGGAQAAR